ncbi:signal peptidase I [Capnocytophaga canis]|uniref:signal peptidase I n=1 Tax=Capnocytophaga canis TaxID=1848903 RepID=UPI00370D7529
MRNYPKVTSKIITLLSYWIITFGLYVLIRIFIFDFHSVSSVSMSPTILPGDHIIVNKLVYGARLYNIFDITDGERTTIYRLKGFQKIKRNDIVVFNMPYPKTREKMEMQLHKFLIKRCIALPKDTLYIRNGVYHINNDSTIRVGYLKIQDKLEKIRNTFNHKLFPKDSLIDWTIKDFGGLYIPQKGDVLKLNRTNAILYKNIIEWEKNRPLIFENNMLWEDKQPLSTHTFEHNYYFMVGDNASESSDSRHWGLVPEEFITGKAWIIWKSKDLHRSQWRYSRFFKLLK